MYARTFGFAFPDSQGGEKTKLFALSATHARFLNGRTHRTASRRVASRRTVMHTRVYACSIDQRVVRHQREKRPNRSIRHSVNSVNLHITSLSNSILLLHAEKGPKSVDMVFFIQNFINLVRRICTKRMILLELELYLKM